MENDYINRADIEIERLPNGVIRIGTIMYHQDLFRAFSDGGLELNTPFEIVKREDSILYIRKLEKQNGK